MSSIHKQQTPNVHTSQHMQVSITTENANGPVVVQHTGRRPVVMPAFTHQTSCFADVDHTSRETLPVKHDKIDR